jgi:hypothetical protein
MCLLAASTGAVLAACGDGSSDGDEQATTEAETSPTQTQTGTERGEVLPEIVAETEAVIAHLEALGAVPDDEARARVSDQFDASQRLRFPPGGPNCRIRAIAAGSAPLVEFTQRAPIFDEVVTDEDETVAVAIALPTIDPDAPASARCVEAVASALATLGGEAAPATSGESSDPPPDQRPTIEVRGSGFTTSAGGFFNGALVENTGPEDLVGVDVGFDVLNAAGTMIGAARPARIPVLPAGATVATATNTTKTECGCEAADIASAKVRFRAGGQLDEAREPATVSGAGIERVGGELMISGTIDNPGSRTLSDPIINYVVLDAGGAVMSGNQTILSVSVSGEGSTPFEMTPPASFTESLPRPAADVVVSVAE